MRSVSRHVCVSLAALACAAAAGAQNPGNAKRNSNQIVREELQNASAANAYELVQALRPQWLRERGNETLEFISPSKATLRWGSGHSKGVIVVHPSTGTFP